MTHELMEITFPVETTVLIDDDASISEGMDNSDKNYEVVSIILDI